MAEETYYTNVNNKMFTCVMYFSRTNVKYGFYSKYITQENIFHD